MSKKDRTPIDKKLAAQIMFASDRTCCVCRIEKQKVQIHHIDGDPSNNSTDNLAVICLHCHSDAHTSGAFVRNLSSELLALYNDSWREIVKSRIVPTAEIPKELELTQEVLLQASLDCHYWKVQFMTLLGTEPPSGEAGQFLDVWDGMAELWVPKYSETNYKAFLPLFTTVIDKVQDRFEKLGAQYSDLLPAHFRVQLLRGGRQLSTEKSGYLWLPSLIPTVYEKGEHANIFFYQRFIGVIRVLREIAREADRLREALVPENGK